MAYDELWVPASRCYIAVRHNRTALAWVHKTKISIVGGPRVELPGIRGPYPDGWIRLRMSVTAASARGILWRCRWLVAARTATELGRPAGHKAPISTNSDPHSSFNNLAQTKEMVKS